VPVWRYYSNIKNHIGKIMLTHNTSVVFYFLCYRKVRVAKQRMNKALPLKKRSGSCFVFMILKGRDNMGHIDYVLMDAYSL
jgi:hypothetical protein